MVNKTDMSVLFLIFEEIIEITHARRTERVRLRSGSIIATTRVQNACGTVQPATRVCTAI
jgi:hypothetical protein